VKRPKKLQPPEIQRQVPTWRAVGRQAPDPDRAQHGLDQLATNLGDSAVSRLDSEHLRVLAALFSGSQPMSALLLRNPQWATSVITPQHLMHPRQEQGLRREVNRWLVPALQAQDYASALRQLRQFHQRELLRIAARDLAQLGDTEQVILELSNVADVCLEAVLASSTQQLVERFGKPYHRDPAGRWQPTEFSIIGLGKLGGRELNYSSDVDLIFVYSDEGHVFKSFPDRKAETEHAMASHQFFKRLAEAFIADLTRSSPDGMLYRIDLRLRPEGDAGPLVRSLPSYENFYAQWGQTWERMMLIKARCVAGSQSLGHEFLEMIQPFRYPRSLSESVLREIATMKARIESEVVRSGELDRDVKRGRGGIREIEFIVQTAQLLNAGRAPFLQGSQTLPVLQKMAQYKLLAGAEAQSLSEAYCFLRNLEHRLQMENNLQTHTIPTDVKSRRRLAALMGFASLSRFESALKRHTRLVRRFYEKSVKVESPSARDAFPKQFKGAEAQWKRTLSEHSFRDPDHALRLLEEFASGPPYAHTSQRTTELAWELIPKILSLCRKQISTQARQELLGAKGSSPRGRAPSFDPASHDLSDPDRVLARLDSFISAYGARSILFEMWASHPQLFELMLLLFDRSEFLAEMAIRTPDLVDDLVLSGRLGRRKSSDEILSELRHGRDDADQHLWLRRYHHAEFMRIGLRDILGLADYEQNFIELTALADACLQYALEVILRKHRVPRVPVALIGLGKLGGRELNYGSDLDVVFVCEQSARRQLPKLHKLAAEVIDLLSKQTELGITFVLDTRLRPDGQKGLLVNTLEAHEEYYRERAQLWEIQALTRTRPVAGNPQLGESFQGLAAALTNFRNLEEVGIESSRRLACFSPVWKQEIARMRQRIEKERTPAGQGALAFKTGSGGLIDAEFVAQAFCLERGWQQANTLAALQRAQAERALSRADSTKLIQSYRALRRIESILRRWSFEGEAVLPVDAAPYYRVSVRCGFRTPEQFREAVAAYRRNIREIYRKVFPAPPTTASDP
jgi:glutamate-ammonia-ligase adenylyltransferase